MFVRLTYPKNMSTPQQISCTCPLTGDVGHKCVLVSLYYFLVLKTCHHSVSLVFILNFCQAIQSLLIGVFTLVEDLFEITESF